ncbi:DsbA family protein [Candidatus Uhrbacteria bacterium]|nr:DsbA family protein [Candidatus Uhrbacteria bacterium]
MEAMELDRQENRRRSWIATIVTLAVLALVIAFAARVFYFADQIKSGGLDLSSFDFAKKLTASIALASAPQPDGEFDVTTTDDPSLGNPGARVTIVEFAEFQCPYSQEASFTMRELAAKYPDDVFYVYRDFPLTDLHPLAQLAAEAGECADEQGKFWEYHDKLFQNQSSLTQESFVAFASELNMRVDQFESCLSSGRYASEVEEDLKDGAEAGVRGTPTFFINGNRIAGAIPAEVMEAIVQSIIQTP